MADNKEGSLASSLYKYQRMYMFGEDRKLNQGFYLLLIIMMIAFYKTVGWIGYYQSAFYIMLLATCFQVI